MLHEILGALATELRSLDWRGPRGLEAAEAAASVTLAVLGALALHSDAPWWAGISAFMVTKASPSVAVPRNVMRIVGSIFAAVIALLVLPTLGAVGGCVASGSVNVDDVAANLARFASSVTSSMAKGIDGVSAAGVFE